jgi:hypothetical protein
VNVRYRAVSCSNHTLKVGGAAYGHDGSEVCFRTSQRLIVHPLTDATNSGKRSTTNNVTSYIRDLSSNFGRLTRPTGDDLASAFVLRDKDVVASGLAKAG